MIDQNLRDERERRIEHGDFDILTVSKYRRVGQAVTHLSLEREL